MWSNRLLLCSFLVLLVNLERIESHTPWKPSSPFSGSPGTLVTPPATKKANSPHEDIPEWKQKLHPGLWNRTRTLQQIVFPGANGRRVEVYLLGTAHVSTDSSHDVRMLLESVHPNVIFLELCDQRIAMMLTPPPSLSKNTTTSESSTNMTNVASVVPPKKRWGLRLGGWRQRRQQPPPVPKEDAMRDPSMYGMATNLLTSMQQDYASSLGVELGGEFRVAHDYWKNHYRSRHIHLILGDRPVHVTLARAWESLGIWGKIKLMVGLVVASFQKPKPEELKEWMEMILSEDSGDLLTESIAELAVQFPTLERVIIQERDAYMACKLYQTCRQLLTGHVQQDCQRVVAIVGAGHVEGMCQWLTTDKGQVAEDVLGPLVETRKPLSPEERFSLVHEVMAVDYLQLQELTKNLIPSR
eukprot:Nitzschia sp. Nitz4//scaffold13_size275219//208256//209494//NITZ4_000904-RA/size275219-processed-gene-0.106-mRNA-1//1//CDS//3329536104//16//frame0